MVNLKAGLFQSFDNLEPARPVWIDEHVVIVRLNKKGSVSDPGNGVFPWSNLWESGRSFVTGTLGEKRRN